MLDFDIEHIDRSLEKELMNKIDNLAKPKGSLGVLEALALQVGLIQQTLSPELVHPVNVIFASDHGIAEERVSPTPKEVTHQIVYNLLRGGAGICFLARQHGIALKVVDAGVDYDFLQEERIIDRKIRKGTRNFLYEPAMTKEEMCLALRSGADVVSDCYREGSNIISFGEMGVGNTAASSMWMTFFTGQPLRRCVGAGSGLDEDGLSHKYEVLQSALEHFREKVGDETQVNPLEIIRYFGGYEMVMAVGGMLRAAELHMVVLVDGFIMSNCALAASKLYPSMKDYCIFGHCGAEEGHKLLLDYMQASPILHLGLRLGEGTGAVCAYPIVDSAVRMINEMHSFRQASIVKYF